MRIIYILGAAALASSATASAAASCGRWVPQSNGTEWRMCVDDQGRKYCELRKGREIRRIGCP